MPTDTDDDNESKSTDNEKQGKFIFIYQLKVTVQMFLYFTVQVKCFVLNEFVIPQIPNKEHQVRQMRTLMLMVMELKQTTKSTVLMIKQIIILNLSSCSLPEDHSDSAASPESSHGNSV